MISTLWTSILQTMVAKRGKFWQRLKDLTCHHEWSDASWFCPQHSNDRYEYCLKCRIVRLEKA